MKKFLIPLLAVLTNTCAQAATFTVTNTSDRGLGSLRWAITNANASPRLDTIAFAIGSGAATITPLSPLPVVTDAVVIDGRTQPGFAGKPLVEINGTSAGTAANGLKITAGYSTIRALAINRFSADGILLQGNGENRVESNFLGTDLTGRYDFGNASRGVQISGSASNIIGGTNPDARNVIAGNNASGILIEAGALGNVVLGNFIGTDVTGTLNIGNTGNGVRIQGASGNKIGGTEPGAWNLISGNYDNGVLLDGGAKGNLVQGNFIGTDVTGNRFLPNDRGVYISNPGTINNTIGGTVSGAGNRIAGNINAGVKVDDQAAIGPGGCWLV